MHSLHLLDKDLNLLQPLRILLEEKHVTRAAERCHLSQPAMSRVLEKLREMFGDELLIRSGRRYERTARGERLFKDLEHVLPRIDELIRDCTFEPQRAQHRFRISMTDYAAVVLLPDLTSHLSLLAPGILLEAVVRDDHIMDDLESGRVDLSLEAAGSLTNVESTVLFSEEFVCLVADNHSFRGKRFKIDDYLKYPHIVVNISAGQQTLVDRPLANLGLRRKVALTVPYFVSAALSINKTNYIATIPKRLLNSLPSLSGVRVVQAPFEIPKFNYVMLWHQRIDQETAHRWLRAQITALSVVVK